MRVFDKRKIKLADKFPPETRTKIMRAVRNRDTGPEMIVRRIAHAMGKRYRLHRSDLPGKPDLTFPRLRKIIFVHGCFWHGHNCKHGTNQPKDNAAYWVKKINRNKERDEKSQEALRAMGWDVLIIWECQLKDREALRDRLKAFLS